MKNRSLNQSGFEIVGVMVALLFVGVVAFAGYKVVNLNKSASTVSDSSSSSAPDSIKTKGDLETTNKALTESGTQLDSNLNDSALDADIDSML